MPHPNFRDFSFLFIYLHLYSPSQYAESHVECLMFNIDFKHSYCPSAQCTLAANAIGSDTSIFNGRSVLGNMIN
jgi:hypothetical protein